MWTPSVEKELAPTLIAAAVPLWPKIVGPTSSPPFDSSYSVSNHRRPVLEQNQLDARFRRRAGFRIAGVAEAAVDHQHHFFGFAFGFGRFSVLPGDERRRFAVDVAAIVDRDDFRFAGDFGFFGVDFAEQVGVEVGFDAVPRFRPADRKPQRHAHFDRDPEGVVFAGARVEVEAVASGDADRDRAERGVFGVAEFRRFPGADAGFFGGTEVVVAGRGEVGDSGCGHFRHRRRHRPVLEHRLFEVGDVVDDHVGPGAAGGDRSRQAFDVLGEGEFAVEGGGEGEIRVGSNVVDDLQHRTTLVVASGGAVFEHVDRHLLAAAVVFGAGQVVALDIFGGVGRDRRFAALDRGRDVVGVGEDADRLARAAGAERFAYPDVARLGDDPELVDALAEHGAAFADRGLADRRFGGVDDRRADRFNTGDAGKRGEGVEVGGADEGVDALVDAAGGGDRRPGFAERRQSRDGTAFEFEFDRDLRAVALQAAGAAGRETQRFGLGFERLRANRRARQFGEFGSEDVAALGTGCSRPGEATDEKKCEQRDRTGIWPRLPHSGHTYRRPDRST